LNVAASLPSVSDSALQNAIKINGKWRKLKKSRVN